MKLNLQFPSFDKDALVKDRTMVHLKEGITRNDTNLTLTVLISQQSAIKCSLQQSRECLQRKTEFAMYYQLVFQCKSQCNYFIKIIYQNPRQFPAL